jgi:FG-GAP-like repeat
MLTLFTNLLGSAVVDLRDRSARVTSDAGPGNDLVLGTRFADDLQGGAGSDALLGFGGRDTLRGGADLDIALGGQGDDVFVFAPGDLIASRERSNSYGGLVDTLLDFRGAGSSETGEQDVIRLEGFGADTFLRFADYGPTRAIQYYEAVDPDTAVRDGFILIALADGECQVTAADVVVMPHTEPTLDLVTASSFDNSISVRLGDGQGGFSGGSDADVGGGFSNVALGDVDGDGDLDLLTPRNFGEGTGDTVRVRLNDGQASFDDVSDVVVADAPGDVALGDIDGDGDLDLATSNYNINSVSVRLGDGQGGFSGGSEVSVGAFTGPASVALGDLDGDGDLDFVVANANSDSVSVRLGDGQGGFGNGSEVGVGVIPEAVALGDLDGDSDLDLTAANQQSGTVSVRLGDGQGGFSGGSEVSVGDVPGDVALGNLDGPAQLTPSGLPYFGPFVPTPAEIDAAWA